MKAKGKKGLVKCIDFGTYEKVYQEIGYHYEDHNNFTQGQDVIKWDDSIQFSSFKNNRINGLCIVIDF